MARGDDEEERRGGGGERGGKRRRKGKDSKVKSSKVERKGEPGKDDHM